MIISRPNNLAISRLGITASAKIGNAVTRNRIKRLLRECFRQHHQQISPSRDILVIARKGAADLSLSQVIGEIRPAVIGKEDR